MNEPSGGVVLTEEIDQSWHLAVGGRPRKSEIQCCEDGAEPGTVPSGDQEIEIVVARE